MKRLLSKIKHYLLVSIVLETVEEILLSKHVAEQQTAPRVTVDSYQLLSYTFTWLIAPVFLQFHRQQKNGDRLSLYMKKNELYPSNKK